MKYKSAYEFLNAPHKSITLMGMSGVGKSYTSMTMEKWDWHVYSCDYEIGTKFLADHYEDRDISSPVSIDDISPLSEFIGKLGDLPLDEFKRRQQLYYNAEMAAVEEAIERADQCKKFVHDSAGSLCEIMDEGLMERLGQASLFVYIKASQQEEVAVLKRAEQYPKPLFYPPAMFEAWVKEYLQVFGIDSANNIPADDFARWVFPRLFETRLPKYQALADKYGVTIASNDLHDIKNEHDLISIITKAMG